MTTEIQQIGTVLFMFGFIVGIIIDRISIWANKRLGKDLNSHKATIPHQENSK